MCPANPMSPLSYSVGPRGVKLRISLLAAVIVTFVVAEATRLVRFPTDERPRGREKDRAPRLVSDGSAIRTSTTSSTSEEGEVYDTLARAFGKVELTKVQDVVLSDHPEAFFLSVLSVNGTLFASYRTTLSSWDTNVVQMSEKFEPVKKTTTHIANTEDARAIELNGEGWLIDNHFLQPRAMTTIDGRRRLVLNTSHLGADFDRGKNWAPFVHQSRLFFVYSLSPLRILECDMPDGTLRWAYGVNHATGENPRDLGAMLMRGGTNGVVYGNYVYGFGRETVYETITCSGMQHPNVAQHYPFLWRFSVSLLDLDAHAADAETQRDDLEIRQIEHPFSNGVNDPASLFTLQGDLYLSVSSCSCACLPEFQSGNAWQHNSIFKVTLRE